MLAAVRKSVGEVSSSLTGLLGEIGRLSAFTGRFLRSALSRPFEGRELIYQCYAIGYHSLFLVVATGFIMGLVLTLQLRPTMTDFGAVSFMPDMVGIAFVREIGPMVTALICAGKIGSGIGAELGSMRVTEQIDAMEVSGTNPFRFLVVTRVWACILMLPLLVIAADAVGLLGSYFIESTRGQVSLALYFNRAFSAMAMGDIIPATVKTFFFGLVIGVVGCYRGYYSNKGTAGVGIAANSAVVISSLLLFLVDFIAVLIADIFYEI
ncbi:phospholipid/cholesterol/gamma-HCH transport system permease protein [Lewinella marina]|uniref:ABC transporter permease n=1 Tax=Neolewinella marina TaxID=438751 RepID=A0A2G0CAS5_9BACT|nr:ABC transporter permease [Neolewinella marina]NJB87198.1 phospholipid/cholesterol/gamma-HCH transport system permease protein [Neolewinella marina]PHK97079.1 ABC transporter permease [Neolewinella marina]